MLLVRQVEATPDGGDAPGRSPGSVATQAAFVRVRDYFLTQDGQPRSRLIRNTKSLFVSPAHWQLHRDLVVGHAPRVVEALAAYRRDLNVLVSRGVWRMFRIAEAEYRRTLDAHAVLDFSDLLLRTLDLLRQMEEFAQSRYRLESRYHHVLVDEFQDTSRAQWELISLLVQSWGEGAGLAHAAPLPPSIFIVGDRKQSIYSFRDADASVLPEAARYLETLRPDRDVRRSISRSFRSVPALLAFVNDVCHDMDKAPARPDAFQYGEQDRFPIDADDAPQAPVRSGSSWRESPEACAEGVGGGDCASHRLASDRARRVHRCASVRSARATSPFCSARARAIASSRSRSSARQIPCVRLQGTRVLRRRRDQGRSCAPVASGGPGVEPAGGRMDAVRIRAVCRTRRSAVCRPHLAAAITSPQADRRIGLRSTRRTRGRSRWHGPGVPGGASWWIAFLRPNCSTVFSASRPTCWSWAALDSLRRARTSRRSAGSCDARRTRAMRRSGGSSVTSIAWRSATNPTPRSMRATPCDLMTVHAAKGLEFPVVFVVNLSRGTGNRRDPIRVVARRFGRGRVSVGWRLPVALRRRRSGKRAGGDQAPAIRGAHAGARPVVPVRRDKRRSSAAGPGQPCGGASGLAARESAAARSSGHVEWQASSGTRHMLRGAIPLRAGFPNRRRSQPRSDSVELATRPFERRRFPCSAGDEDLCRDECSADRDSSAAEPSVRPAFGVDRLRGTLVHRLLQRLGMPRR